MRFAFIGLGRATRVFHLPALARLAGVVVVGGFDESGTACDDWSRATDLPTFATADELLSRAGADVVIVATPPDSHAEYSIRALRSGAHVICEKPFTMTAAQADEVLAAAAEAGRQVAVNHEFREKPIFRVPVERIRQQEFGRLLFAQIWQLMDTPPWTSPVSWRAAMADRTLLEGGVHLVDLVLQLFDELPLAVYASHSAGFHTERDADPVHLLTLEFSDDRLAQITIDRICPAASRYLEMRADCEGASLRASLGGHAAVRIGKQRGEAAGVHLELGLGGRAWVEEGNRRRTLARASRRAGVDATFALLCGIVSALRTGEQPPSSGREARDTIAIIEAAYESAASGERIELEPRYAATATASSV